MESHNKSSISAVWFYTDQQYSASEEQGGGLSGPSTRGVPLNVFLPGGLGENTLHHSTHLLVLNTRVTMMPPGCTHVQSTHGRIQELQPF